MLNSKQLSDLIIIPTLKTMLAYSDSAVELLLFTCAVESDGGTYLKQNGGPALGIYQMEPNDHSDIWMNFIYTSASLLNRLVHNFNIGKLPEPDRMIYDLQYATIMSRMHYLRVSSSLPLANDVEGLWNYYKLYYNTPRGAAEKALSIQKYYDFKKA